MNLQQMRERRAALAKRMDELAKLAEQETRSLNTDEQAEWDKLDTEYRDLGGRIKIASRAEEVGGEMRSVVSPASAPAPAEQPKPEQRQLPGRHDVRPDICVIDEDVHEGRSTRTGDNWGDDNGDETENANGEATFATGGSAEQRTIAFKVWARKGRKMRQGESEALRATGIDPSANIIELRGLNTFGARRLRESRAMSAVDQAAGGSTVAPGFVPQFELALLYFGGVLNVSEILRTDTGADLSWPTANDTTNEGEIIGENTTATDQDVATGAVKFGAHIFSSKIVKVPVALIQDSAFDLASEIGRMCGTRIGRKTNSSCTTGTGMGMPRGIVTAATLGKTAASATAIKYDELVDLVYSVDPAYLVQPGCGFMMNAQILAALAKLKDGNGRPLWDNNNTNQLGIVNGVMQGKLMVAGLTFPFTINQSMASSVTNSAKTILFGALNKYKVRQVQTIRVRRLVERYAELDQEGFVAFLRQDGNLLDAGTNPVKYLQQLA